MIRNIRPARLVGLYASLVVFVILQLGCGTKPEADPRPIIKKKKHTPLSAPEIPVYNKSYVLWWVSHAYLECTIDQKKPPKEKEHALQQTTESLTNMTKMVPEAKKEKIAEFAAEYEKLRPSILSRSTSRRTVEKLSRIKVKIKKLLAPQKGKGK